MARDRDWGGYRAAADQAAEDRRRDRARGPVACPYDGEPLVEHNGVRNCPWGDYSWSGVGE